MARGKPADDISMKVFVVELMRRAGNRGAEMQGNDERIISWGSLQHAILG